MTSLELLDVHNNCFQIRIPAFLGNMTSLKALDMAANYLQGEIPAAWGNICNLCKLDLSLNNIMGGISELPEAWSRCGTTGLEELNLSYNNLSGGLPPRIAQLTRLRRFSLFHNRMSGTIPKGIGQLSRLESLDLSFNTFNGVVFEAHFVHLGRLKELSLTSNSLVFNFSSSWIPPFQLQILGRGSCRLGPDIPGWFWKLMASNNISVLDLSNNNITGRQPKFFKFSNARVVILSSNQFEGPLPRISAEMRMLDLSNNSFSGTISPSFMETMPNLTVFQLSSNHLHGTIPSSVCNLMLIVLDLSNNFITGGLPECQGEISFKLLQTLNLANNNLSGKIPDSIFGRSEFLAVLQLNHNNFSGEIPLALRNRRSLTFIDLGENRLSGRIPAWIGEDLSYLMILRLHLNMFSGNIPPQIMRLFSLQILDLAHNDLSGPIPQLVGNLSAMIKKHELTYDASLRISRLGHILAIAFPFSHRVSLLLDMKGGQYQYNEILPLVVCIDFSDNKLSGEIPAGLTDLVQLQSLNLSNNQFTGKIPEKIGDLKSFESLDLSKNRLSGTIPSSMSVLSSLSHLNLSYNNLSGKIPSGNQLQTLDDPPIYIGNNDLCGFPSQKKCPGEETSQAPVSTGGNYN